MAQVRWIQGGYHVDGVGLSQRDDKFGEDQLVGLL